MIAWPQPLVDDLARRRAMIFTGSGVSRNSQGNGGRRPPLWKEFLIDGANLLQDLKIRREVVRLVKQQDLLKACEILKTALGHQWDDHLNQSFLLPQYQSAPIHSHIFKLDSRLVVTQNFDKIYDTFAQANSQGTVVVKNYYDPDISNFIRKRHRVVIKAHGTIDQPNEMVFTKGDYARARHKHAAFHALLDGLMLTHTCLFLGCGLADPDIHILLERCVQLHPTNAPHFLVTSEKFSPPLASAIKKNLNLELLPYSPAKDHEELTQSLKDLLDRVEVRKGELAAALDW